MVKGCIVACVVPLRCFLFLLPNYTNILVFFLSICTIYDKPEVFLPRYPHSLTVWVRISVLKTRNKGGFEQSLNVCEFGKKGCFYSLEFAELRIRGGFRK